MIKSSDIRAVFCGPLNCGKTNALLALLIYPNGLRFENVYIWSKSLNQPEYQFLKDLLETIERLFIRDLLLVIDKDSDMGNGRYRKNFDQYLVNTSAN